MLALVLDQSYSQSPSFGARITANRVRRVRESEPESVSEPQPAPGPELESDSYKVESRGDGERQVRSKNKD